MPKAWCRLCELDGNLVLAVRFLIDLDDSAVPFFPAHHVLESW